MTTKGELLINLTPLPRYQSICCVDPSHGLQGNDSQGTLNTLLRDGGVYMGSHSPLSRPDHLDVAISPLDAVGPPGFLYPQTSMDNVHPTREFLASLTCAILLIWKKSRSTDFPGVRGLLPPDSPSRTSLEWRWKESGLAEWSLTTAITPRLSAPSVSPHPPQLGLPAWIICHFHGKIYYTNVICFSGLLQLPDPFMQSWPTSPQQVQRAYHRRHLEHQHLLCLASLVLISDVL